MPGTPADATTDQLPVVPDSATPRVAPGLVVVFADGKPQHRLLPLAHAAVLGRSADCDVVLDDTALSRRHVEVRLEGEGWTIRDLDSRNGTFVDGRPIGSLSIVAPRILRIGKTLLLLRADVTPHFGLADLRVGDVVVGPSTRRVLAEAASAAADRRTLLVTGESGAGKEHVARAFHARGPHRQGPFLALNCAALPADLIEAELFGVTKGAYSGAVAGRPGLFERATGGVVFLDEVGELSAAAQAKLLRVLAEREVVPVGGTSARAIDVLVCAGTNADVRLAVTEGRFRHDLLTRIAEREVHVPPLADRPEEIPYLVELALERAGIAGDPTGMFVEKCVMRRWAGNVRELFIAVDRAAARAKERGATEVTRGDWAYEDMPRGRGAGGGGVRVSEPPRGFLPPSEFPPAVAKVAAPRSGEAAHEEALLAPWASRTKEEVVAALRASGGSLSGAAKVLGVHRSTVHKLVERYGLRGKKG